MMITVKSHDTSKMHKNLEDAIRAALEDTEPKGLWVQKYEELDGEVFWDVSFDKVIGESVAAPGYIDVFKTLYEIEGLDAIAVIADVLIGRNWKEKHTILVEECIYHDEYEINGVSRNDFS